MLQRRHRAACHDPACFQRAYGFRVSGCLGFRVGGFGDSGLGLRNSKLCLRKELNLQLSGPLGIYRILLGFTWVPDIHKIKNGSGVHFSLLHGH